MIGRWAAQVRLRHWAHFLALPLASVDRSVPAPVYGPAAARGVAVAFFTLAFGYLLNAVSDRHMDLEPGKNAVPSGGVAPQRVAVVVLAALALGIAATGPWPVVVATSVCVLSGWIYSAGPRLKSVPVVGSALNVGNFAPLLFVGLATPAVPPSLLVLVAVFVPLLLQNQLLHEAADATEDRSGHVGTTFTRFGRRVAAFAAGACGGIGVAVVAAFAPCGPSAARWLLVVAFAALFAVAYPAALFRFGDDGPRIAFVRVTHRWTASSAGALVYFAVVACPE